MQNFCPDQGTHSSPCQQVLYTSIVSEPGFNIQSALMRGVARKIQAANGKHYKHPDLGRYGNWASLATSWGLLA